MGVNALGLTGADLNYMLSDKRPVKDVDYGFVGDVRRVDSEILADLVRRGVVPVLAPLTHDGRGNMLNTNADTIASEAATAFARHFDVTLAFCFEKKGVLSNPDDEESVIPQIDREILYVVSASNFQIEKEDDENYPLKKDINYNTMTFKVMEEVYPGEMMNGGEFTGSFNEKGIHANRATCSYKNNHHYMLYKFGHKNKSKDKLVNQKKKNR